MAKLPLFLRPFYWLYSAIVGTLFIFSYWIVRTSSQITFSKHPPVSNAIYCLWHDNWISYFICFPHHKNHVWMSHAAWYMQKIMVVLWWLNVREVVYGSSGDHGREASDRLVEYLKQGKSTVVAPDGPYGPKRQAKKGALHMAMQSGVPLVPLRFELSSWWVVPRTWEGKKYPLPFSKIHITFGAPISVTADNFNESLRTLDLEMT